MCVTHKDFTNGFSLKSGCPIPAIGEICEVVDCKIGYGVNDFEVECYKLNGYPINCFDQRNFAIISNIDETELVNTKEEVI